MNREVLEKELRDAYSRVLVERDFGKDPRRSIKKLEGLIEKPEKEGHAGLWTYYRGKLREYREGTDR